MGPSYLHKYWWWSRCTFSSIYLVINRIVREICNFWGMRPCTAPVIVPAYWTGYPCSIISVDFFFILREVQISIHASTSTKIIILSTIDCKFILQTRNPITLLLIIVVSSTWGLSWNTMTWLDYSRSQGVCTSLTRTTACSQVANLYAMLICISLMLYPCHELFAVFFWVSHWISELERVSICFDLFRTPLARWLGSQSPMSVLVFDSCVGSRRDYHIDH